MPHPSSIGSRGSVRTHRDHLIVCGFGRVGREVARGLQQRGVAFVVIDNSTAGAETTRADGYLVIQGDATEDEVLLGAGIRRARALLAASDSDAVHTYIVLAAKAVNPGIFVVARVAEPSGDARIRRAGADQVISPTRIGGRRMVLAALQPLTFDFMDVLATGSAGGGILAEVLVSEDSLVLGDTVANAFASGGQTRLLAVQATDGQIAVGPDPERKLSLGDRLMVLGREEEIAAIGRTRGPSPGRAAPADAEPTAGGG